MEVNCFDIDGNAKAKVNLPDDIFATDYNKSLISRVIESERSNRQQGTHKIKNKSEVSGGGKKPWKQKGTGNARHGSSRSPIWKGGGVVFGPVVRDHKINLPRKMRKVGMRAILSKRAKEGELCLLDGLKIDGYSTKKIYSIFKNLGVLPNSTVVFIGAGFNEYWQKSFANIRNLELMHAKRLKAPELYFSGKVLIAKEALAPLLDIYKKEVSV